MERGLVAGEPAWLSEALTSVADRCVVECGCGANHSGDKLLTVCDGWRGRCGNTPNGDGFYPCDKQGEEMEPLIGSGWAGLYACARCGKIVEAARS